MLKRLIQTSLAAAFVTSSANAQLQLNKGDNVAIIGNTLADWLQHEGSLETMIYAAHPGLDLTIRNLGFSGDELNKRSRSDGFGSPDEWLTKVKADVIFAFFGFNESFAGADGLEKFKQELDAFLKKTKEKNYNGEGNSRVVLFSPIAWEDLKSKDHRDGKAENERMRPYVEAMGAVATTNGVTFVDLFAPSLAAYAQAETPLTVNGIHLTEPGYAALAPAMFEGLFGKAAPDISTKKDLQAAVKEKSWQWHQRYRTVDGYNVYGGRSGLAYADKTTGKQITNNEIMQQEMRVRDVMTENRDRTIWAAARGEKSKPDDSNLPPVATITTNKPGTLPDGSHEFPSGEAMIANIKTDAGLKVNLFADEAQWPELVNPVQMAWDTRGRLWVAAWNNYPERPPQAKVGDHLLIFEDTDGDGKADKMTKFLDNLNCPTGFQFYKDGVLVMQAPDVWFVRDTDGDGKGDSRVRVFAGLDSADSHHQTNAMCLEPGGAVYFSDGVFHRTQSETYDGIFRNSDGGIYRFEPRTGKFVSHMLYGFANPHGRVFDRWGNDYVTDATGNNTYFAPAASGYLDAGQKHAGIKDFWNRPSRPCPGTAILSSRHFPDDWMDDFLNLNVITFHGIYRVDMLEEGSGITGKSAPDLLWSKHDVFRPTAAAVGPDGALYVCDWSNAIIGHMQHHLRDPNRDKQHGRVYRVTYEGRPLLKPKKIHGESIENLLELLKEPENGVRELAKIQLDTHDSVKVAAAAKKWAAGLNPGDKDHDHHLTEALWVHQWQNVVDLDLLDKVLSAKDARARAAAVRVACYWRDRIPNVLDLVRKAANDADPRPRLQALRTASFFRTWEAADIALETLKHPQDYYLEYTFKETMRQLEQFWRPALSEGKPLAANNPSGVNYLLGSVSTADLSKLPKSPLVYTALLTRPDVPEADRILAAGALAEEKKADVTTVMLDALNAISKDGGKGVDDLCRLILRQPAKELDAAKARFATLADPTSGAPENVRRTAMAALFTASGDLNSAWNKASSSTNDLADFLGAVPMITDPKLRESAAAKIRPLVGNLPAAMLAQLQQGGSKGRFVRISLPRHGTLTLAEVEVFSDGKNIAPKGKATQSSNGNDGGAKRAVDGNKSGAWGDGGQTHSNENEANPWWELDLGTEAAIEKIGIWNRTDDSLGRRLDGYTLSLLDGSRKVVAELTKQPAPAVSVEHQLKGDPVGSLQRALIRALVSTNVDPQNTFKTLAAMTAKGENRLASAQGIMQLPRSAWDNAAASATADALLAWAKTTAPETRTSQEYVELAQVCSELAEFLPKEKAVALRKDLRKLGVSVFVLKTVREQMRYDQARLVVEVGKPFEVIFENEDMMPHNLVFSQPGSKDEIGAAAQTMDPNKKDSQGRSMVPPSGKIFAASRLLEAGQTETLKVKAPDKEGSYDFVCTFPGHWMIMWGRLEVVKDVDAYLEANPKPTVVPPTFALPQAK